MNHKLDKETPRFDVQLSFDEIGVLLDDNQYRDAISLVDMYHFYIRQHQVGSRTTTPRMDTDICSHSTKNTARLPKNSRRAVRRRCSSSPPRPYWTKSAIAGGDGPGNTSRRDVTTVTATWTYSSGNTLGRSPLRSVVMWRVVRSRLITQYVGCRNPGSVGEKALIRRSTLLPFHRALAAAERYGHAEKTRG